MILLFIGVNVLANSALSQVSHQNDEYCNNEIFRPQCNNDQAIVMKNATYGRMQVGKCVTAEEVEAQRDLVGNYHRYLGCSVDVLDILDEKCSGKTNCEAQVAEILEKNSRPCFPGLMLYLEALYYCVTAADEKRSCVVKVSMKPTHIIDSPPDQRICGTKTQPWIAESQIGQKISVTLIDFNSKVQGDGKNQLCKTYGTIIDKTGNRNNSVCGGRGQRQSKILLSAGNSLEIDLSSTDVIKNTNNNARRFILVLEAVGCSEIVPPEDTWLKRKDDAVVIGCYSTRQTWQLSCNEGKWIGVLGNCSNKLNAGLNENPSEEEDTSSISDQEQVLAIVAISGCTFAVCLAIVCVGTICLRRYYNRFKSQQDYKSFSLRRNPETNQHLIRGIAPVTESLDMENKDFFSKQIPTYSFYAGDINSYKNSRDITNILGNTNS